MLKPIIYLIISLKRASQAFFLITTYLIATDAFGREPGMVLIPAGEINIGALKKTVYLNRFYMDKTEVTQKSFEKIMGGANFFFKGDNHPAEQISWFKAKAYCEKIGKRLPTELE